MKPMKKLFKTLGIVVAVYLLLSFTASLAARPVTSFAYDIVTHRAPLLLVEVVTATVEGYDEHGTPYAMTDDGFYLVYTVGIEPGTRVRSLIVWNPLNNYEDDIIGRYDMVA